MSKTIILLAFFLSIVLNVQISFVVAESKVIGIYERSLLLMQHKH